MPDVLTATLESARLVAPEVKELTLRLAAPLDYAPGQWVSLRLPVGEHPPLVRAYTMATPPLPDGRLVLCFDRVSGGRGSEYLWNLSPGSPVEWTGPLGSFTLPDSGDLVLAAQYTGIVPFRAMLLDLAARGGAAPRRVHLVYGARRREDLAYHDELKSLAETVVWLDYRPVVLEGAADDDGIATGSEADVVEALAADWLPFTAMVCGVRDFTFPMRAHFMERFGFERRAVKVENYTGPSQSG